MKLSLNHHTVVLLIGPTRCGKSTFATNLKNQVLELTGKASDALVISSDGLRRTLLGNYSLHARDPAMLEVSEQAFSMLFNSLEAAISFPVNTPFVVVDTRGMDSQFRERIRKIAEKNNYRTMAVLFDYKQAKDYLPGLTEAETAIAERDVAKFRRKVLPEVRSRDYHNIVRVKAKDDCRDPIELTLPDLPEITNCCISNASGIPIAVIGDSHECVDELKQMISQIEAEQGPTQIIHLSDYLDKGGQTKEMIEYLYERNSTDIFVKANHEAYLYRRLNEGEEFKAADPEIEKKYFTALPILQADADLRAKFNEIYEMSVPFVKVSTPGQRTLYITHAPCSEKYLGKLDRNSQKAQRTLFVKNREGDVREEMKFIYDEASMSRPLHIFGHVAHCSPALTYKNKVFLDTGCVAGGFLTSFIIKNDHYEFMAVPAKEPRVESDLIPKILPEQVVKPFDIRDYDLTPEDERYVRSLIRNKIRYVSGTMAPAPSRDGQLEPLSAALEYFRSKGVESVTLEPKYMGSRCQVYLYKEDDAQGRKSFAVSRNGYVIRHVEGLDEELNRHREKVLAEGWYDGMWTEIILDGELLPWAALGKGLIEHTFRSYEALVGFEVGTLWQDKEFAKLDISEHYDAAGRMADLSIYGTTLSLYTKETPLEFKPFNILSCDGEVVTGDAETMFADVSDDKCVYVDLNLPEHAATAEEFFEQVTVELGMEGLVVKPNYDNPADRPKHVPEYMKVRNERYLTLIYGYDYKRRYAKLVAQKNISGKVAISLRESALAAEMLTAPEDKLKELFVKMIGELKKERELDPRL